MIVLLVLGFLGTLYIVKMISRGSRKEDTALDILKKRYAKGEITRDEYELIKDGIPGKKEKP